MYANFLIVFRKSKIHARNDTEIPRIYKLVITTYKAHLLKSILSFAIYPSLGVFLCLFGCLGVPTVNAIYISFDGKVTNAVVKRLDIWIKNALSAA